MNSDLSPGASRLKGSARRAVHYVLQRSGVADLLRVHKVRTAMGWASILVFHTLSEDRPHSGIAMSPKLFRSIVVQLKNDYVVLSLSGLLERLRDRRPLSGREVVITFDDGYLDNYEHAAPVLHELNLSACFFLTVGYIGTDRQFSWDSAAGYRTVMMDWNQAKELRSMGFEIGCHTWNHPDLGTEPIESAGRELFDARARLQDELGAEVVHFAYPFGGVQNIRREWVEAIRKAGFVSNSGCHGGSVQNGNDPFWLPRIGCHQRSVRDVRIELDNLW